jgi:hypothetical protein
MTHAGRWWTLGQALGIWSLSGSLFEELHSDTMDSRQDSVQGLARIRNEAWLGSGKRPSWQHISVFRCFAFVHIPKDKQKRLDCRATPGIFFGYSNSTNQ